MGASCHRCGYDLTGVRLPACPECGCIIDATAPTTEPWPRPPRLAMLLTAPMTLAALVLLIASTLTPIPPAAMAAMLMILCLVLPGAVAWRLSTRCAVRYERRLVGVVLYLAGVVYAAGVALVVVIASSIIGVG